ncbi:MAG: glutamine synthetase [Glaciihabitans sp.]|nr:glutamine synthetase [Glaciihabitans sp.]
MRNVDERRVSEAGGGTTAKPMLAKDRDGFVERHNLWSEGQYAAAGQMRRVMDEVGIEMVQFVFADQHGILRGKTLTRTSVAEAMRSGVRAPSSLLLKDTSGRSVFSVFDPTELGTLGRFAGAGDVVMVPDPTTFRILPWTERTGLVLCSLRFPDGSEVPFCTRSILHKQLDALATRDLGLTVGAELEFHVFRADPAGFAPEQVGKPGQPGAAPQTTPTTAGGQLLHAEALGELDDLVQALYSGLTSMDLPLRTLELEFGPSQLELTLDAGDAATVADDIVLVRTAVRQIARSLGYHATFMSRPVGAETASTGWHLHQSLCNLRTGANVFVPTEPGTALSDTGRYYLGGLLEHATAAAAFSTPTVNGYKRYQPYSLAPDRILWGIDNKGAMVRAVGGAGDPATRLENRSGEPGANPYLYIAAQLVCGMDGLDRTIDPGEPADNPYTDDAKRLPSNLGAAVDALSVDTAFIGALGADVIDWYTSIKRSEFDRYLAHVSDWEQREYFALL